MCLFTHFKPQSTGKQNVNKNEQDMMMNLKFEYFHCPTEKELVSKSLARTTKLKPKSLHHRCFN